MLLYLQVCSNSAYPQHSGERYRTMVLWLYLQVTFGLGTLDSGERSLHFGLLVYSNDGTGDASNIKWEVSCFHRKIRKITAFKCMKSCLICIEILNIVTEISNQILMNQYL